MAFHKTLAEKLSLKKGEKYAQTMMYIRTRLSNLAIRSALLCVRGNRRRVLHDAVSTEDARLSNLEIGVVE